MYKKGLVIFLLLIFLKNFTQAIDLREKIDFRGEVWPIPYEKKYDYSTVYQVDVRNLKYSFDLLEACEAIINDNVERYSSIFKIPNEYYYGSHPSDSEQEFEIAGIISEIEIVIEDNLNCDLYPTLSSSEFYQIRSSSTGSVPKITIIAHEIWGVIRAFETLKQAMFWHKNEKYQNTPLVFKMEITDFPNYSHRGFMLDTARHFIKLELIEQLLDAMAYHKFNVFHWHLVDDQSFPFQSQVYPELWQISAFKPVENKVYSIKDVKKIIEMAKNRGIRVIPEIDTPGHTKGFCRAFDPNSTHPAANSTTRFCPTCDLDPFNSYGPADPSKEINFQRISNLWAELRTIFADQFIHLGGDEASFGFSCWQYDKEIQEWAEHEPTITDPKSGSEIQNYWMNRVYNITKSVGFDYIVWNEVFDGTDPNSIPDELKPIVQIWEPWGPELTNGWKETMKMATESGYKAILSTNWYLDLFKYPSELAFEKFYKIDPRNFGSTSEQAKKNVIGGETAYWIEYADGSSVVAKSFPRSGAVAERLWTADDKLDIKSSIYRMERFICDLLSRGIPAEPLGPGSCPINFGSYERPYESENDEEPDPVPISTSLTRMAMLSFFITIIFI